MDISLKHNKILVLRDKLSPGTKPGFLKSEKMLRFKLLYIHKSVSETILYYDKQNEKHPAITSAKYHFIGNNISLSGNNICHIQTDNNISQNRIIAGNNISHKNIGNNISQKQNRYKVVITSATIMAITSAKLLNQYIIGNNISLSGMTSATIHWP